MPGFNLPYQPIRQQLYSRHDLFAGFDAANPASYAHTLDFAIYRHFVAEGRNYPDNPYTGMMQALHDNTIHQAITTLLAGRQVAAIMGGHKMRRDSPAYRNVAVLARRLTRHGILVASGGGPGAMEASHLGASLAPEPDSALDAALALLAKQPAVPDLSQIVDPQGNIDAALVAQAHAWFAPALAIASSLPAAAESLAIPTWHYGHEPTSPLAGKIAKFFQNSIREDGLLAFANHGVVFSEGRAGTIQEIFQDGAQNYYRSFNHFSPMVLLGVDYWTVKFPVTAVLQSLFKPEDFAQYVLITDDVDAAAAFVEAFQPA